MGKIMGATYRHPTKKNQDGTDKEFEWNDLVDTPGTAAGLDPLGVVDMFGARGSIFDPSSTLKAVGLKKGGLVKKTRPKAKAKSKAAKPRGHGIARVKGR